MAAATIPSEARRSEALKELIRNREAEVADIDRYLDLVLSHLASMGWTQTPNVVLDTGCGGGRTTGRLRARGFRAVGVDLDAVPIAVASEVHGPGGFVRGTAERLPFRDTVFDLVIMEEILEHVGDWRSTLAEGARVLAPGGALVVSTSNRLCPRQQEINAFFGWPWLPGFAQRRLLARFEARGGTRFNFAHYPAVHWFTPWKLKASIRHLGFSQALSPIDLALRRDHRGLKGLAAKVVGATRPLGAHELLHVRVPGLSVYAIKGGRPEGGG